MQINASLSLLRSEFLHLGEWEGEVGSDKMEPGYLTFLYRFQNAEAPSNMDPLLALCSWVNYCEILARIGRLFWAGLGAYLHLVCSFVEVTCRSANHSSCMFYSFVYQWCLVGSTPTLTSIPLRCRWSSYHCRIQLRRQCWLYLVPFRAPICGYFLGCMDSHFTHLGKQWRPLELAPTVN